MDTASLLIRRPVLRAVLAATASLVLLLGAQPRAALAHAEMSNSTPADGVELPAPPTELRLVFSERPDLKSLSVRLFDRRGQEVPLGAPVNGALDTTVVVPISAQLLPGPYTVVWFVISAEDAHPEANEFVFGVGEPAGAPSVTADDLTGSNDTLVTMATLFAILALTLVLGAASQAAVFRVQGPRIVAVALSGVGLYLVSLLIAAAAAPKAPVTISGDSSRLFGSIDPADAARIGLVGLLAVAIAAGARLRAPRQRRRAWIVALGLAIALAWLHVARSHAAGVGILPWVSVAWGAVDTALADPGLYAWFGTAFEAARQLNVLVGATHFIAVGVWVGGLLVASVLPFRPGELAAWHPRFSRVALVAFLVVAATGLYQAVLYLPAPDALVTTDYGRVLVAKHVFVVGVLAIAALNRFVVGPALRRSTDPTRPAHLATRAIRIEALIGIGVLAVTGVLATTPPARPAAGIFLRPDIVARVQDPTVQVAADRGDHTLTIAPISDTQYRLTLSGPGLAFDPAAEVSTYHPEDKTERRLPLREEGAGWVAEGLAFSRDGDWVVSAQAADGQIMNFRVEVKFGRVGARNDDARRAWDAAIDRTEKDMRSARMVDELTDGLSLMLFGDHDFVAPDRERFNLQGRFTAIAVDGRRYTRQAGSDAWAVRQTGAIGASLPGSNNAGTTWPWFGFLRPAVGVTFAGEATQDGRRCRVLVGVDSQSDVTYEIWVGEDDGMIHRLVMGVPGHYMVNAYYDINESIDIEAPSGQITPEQ